MKPHHLLTACAALLALVPGPAAAQTTAVPGYISYQGRVVDAAGANVGAGTPVNRTVIFRIWDSPSSTSTANLIYSESQTVTVSEGEFSVLVGQGVANGTQTFGYSESGKYLADLGTAFNGSARYLGVTVAAAATIALTDNEITPRQQIVSTAFAMRAKFAESIGSSSDLTLTPLSGTASNYGLGWYGTERLFGGTAVDGPVLYGNAGGALGSNASGTRNTALRWDASGRVGIGATSISSTTNKLTLQGDMVTTPADQLTIRGSADNNKRLLLGYDTASNKASLQSYTAASTAGPLLLNPGGGNVIIGSTTTGNTTAPVAKLSIGTPIFGNADTLGTSFYAGAGALGAIAGSELLLGNFGFTTANSQSLAISGYRTAAGTTWADTALVLGMNVDIDKRAGAFMTLHSNKNVGIGNTTPGFPLSMSNAMGDKIALWGISGTSTGFGVQSNLLQIHTDTSAGDVGFGYGSSAAMTETMRIKGNGNVGIGTNAPGFPLNFASTLGDKIALYGNSGAHFGLGVQNNQFQIHTDTNAADVVFGFGTSSAMTETMRIKGSGYVGIGTTTPGFPLTVAATANGTYTGGTPAGVTANSTSSPGKNGHDAFTVGGTYSPTSFTWPTAIYADGAVAGSAFVAMSDLRIKDIVNRSSTRSDLALINQLQVTDYRLKDSIANGTAIRKGFIAQEVRKIIPEAVSPSPGYIPDIYVLATQSVYDAAQKRLSVTLAKPHELAVGEWVRIHGGDNTMETKVLTVESATSFTVASEKPVAKAFVYGRRVDDFLTVDYDRLFTTGIGAIQELDRQLKEKDAKIAALEAKVADQDKRSTAQADEVTSQNARLVALEKMMSKAGAPETVSIKLGDQ